MDWSRYEDLAARTDVTFGRTHHSTGRCAMKPRSAGEFKRS